MNLGAPILLSGDVVAGVVTYAVEKYGLKYSNSKASMDAVAVSLIKVLARLGGNKLPNLLNIDPTINAVAMLAVLREIIMDKKFDFQEDVKFAAIAVLNVFLSNELETRLNIKSIQLI